MPGNTAADEGVVTLFVTVPNEEVGRAIATRLVTDHLAACCNMVPGLTSIYRWEGKVTEDAELLLIIKTRANLVPELTAAVREQHPYETCEVLAFPVVGGSAPYLQWVLDSTKASS